MPDGHVGLVLHAHLPYVMAHGRWPHGMDWLCEAASETYIPLLRTLWSLRERGCTSKLTMGITPVLAEQLRDPDFAFELDAYCVERVKRAREAEETLRRTGEVWMADQAAMWHDYYEGIRRTFGDECGGDIVGKYGELQDEGRIELITCAATHGYLPLLGRDTSVQAQIRLGVATYEKHFGRSPRGIWLPECAYRPRYEWVRPGAPEGTTPVLRKGVDEFLSESGIEYFIVDTHLLRGGKALGVYRHRFGELERLWLQFEKEHPSRAEEREARNPLRPYLVNSAPSGRRPVGIFVRDADTALQVWSGEHGYPGDANYLDFHKKYFPGGFRFWQVTDAKADLADKGPYDPVAARARIPVHAEHFVGLARELVGSGNDTVPPMLCCPFDAELFGHWWAEGTEWIGEVMLQAEAQPGIQATSLGDYLVQHPAETMVDLPEGSWGEGGYHFIWLNDDTSWTWDRIYECEDRFAEVLAEQSAPEGVARRLLTQAAREMLLLQSSDWQFLISTIHAADYAELRFDGHYQAFRRLADLVAGLSLGREPTESDIRFVEEVEARDKLFADIDLEWFRRVEHPA